MTNGRNEVMVWVLSLIMLLSWELVVERELETLGRWMDWVSNYSAAKEATRVSTGATEQKDPWAKIRGHQGCV